MSTTVKYFHSAMNGAPTLNGTAGSLIAVLDACLVNGFNMKTVDSLVVASNVATMTMSTGVGAFEVDAIVLVSGATPAGLNGAQRITAVSANSVSFATTGIANQTATGTISAKLDPAGWEKAFSGTNVAAYRSSDVTGTRMFLRVDDTSATNARVVGYESMTDANTGVNPFPTAAQLPGGGWWPKANGANSNARAWTLASDGLGFILHIHTATSGDGASGCLWKFGDFQSLKAGDAYACSIQCHNSDQASYTSSLSSAMEYCHNNNGAAAVYVARSYTTIGQAVAATHFTPLGMTGSISGNSGGTLASAPYPNGPNTGLFLHKKYIYEPSICLRGHERGLFITPQGCHNSFSWRDKIDGQGEYVGRKMLAIKCGAPAGTNSQGVAFIDITGPWGE